MKKVFVLTKQDLIAEHNSSFDQAVMGALKKKGAPVKGSTNLKFDETVLDATVRADPITGDYTYVLQVTK